jgi:hypothetical protein
MQVIVARFAIPGSPKTEYPHGSLATPNLRLYIERICITGHSDKLSPGFNNSLSQFIGRFWAVGRTFHEQLPFDIALENCIENPHYRWLISKARPHHIRLGHRITDRLGNNRVADLRTVRIGKTSGAIL